MFETLLPALFAGSLPLLVAPALFQCGKKKSKTAPPATGKGGTPPPASKPTGPLPQVPEDQKGEAGYDDLPTRPVSGSATSQMLAVLPTNQCFEKKDGVDDKP